MDLFEKVRRGGARGDEGKSNVGRRVLFVVQCTFISMEKCHKISATVNQSSIFDE